MSEFKAQILGIFIVITLFVMVGNLATGIFDNTFIKIESLTDYKIEEIVGESFPIQD